MTQGFAIHFGAGLLSLLVLSFALAHWERETLSQLRKLHEKDA